MADYDFFDLTGLPFDPPEKAAKKVSTAIDKAKKDLDDSLSTATQQLERDKINGKLAFLKTSFSGIFSSDGKLTSNYEDLAGARTEQEIKNLTLTVSLLQESGSRLITNGTVRIHRQKTKLSKEHVEDVFRASGFTISELDPLKAMPRFPVNAEKTYTELEALRESKDSNPNGAGLKQVRDLYAFAAYLEGEPENAAGYRSKSTPELAALLDSFARKFSTRNDNMGKLCASLATAGKMYVFNSEDNRQAYEAYLKYKTPALTELFSTLKNLPSSSLLDAKFAESCVRKISDVFGDYETALAIYNKEAGLKDEPYIPERAVFYVKCQYCQNLTEFTDVMEAQKINKCSHCGKPLYKQCNNCHKNVLVSLDRCPECGFVFASAIMFAKYFAAAEQALRRSDFETARSSLLQAQSADPSEKRKTDELAARISAEEKKYEQPVNDLRQMIAGKMFQKASGTVAGIIGKFPGLNVSEFEAQINAALSQARTRFENAGRFSPSAQADECVAILRDCVDFEPALSFLQSTPPESCKGFSVGMDSLAGYANISWTPSSEQGILYQLVRKQGKEIPNGKMDGKVLLDNTKDTAYSDKSILPGQWYSYAVFTVRHEVFSSAIGKTVVLLADLTEAHTEQINTTVRLTWNAPKNSTGVTIYRTQNGTETVLTNSAHGSFEDNNVQYGTAYHYKLCVNYVNQPASQGIVLVITPMFKIDSFSISATQLKENTYKVSWDINRRGIDLRILVDEKLVRELKSDAGSCDLNLPADGFRTITVLAYSGGDWLRSNNCPQVNTYSPCSIDKAASRLHEDAIAGLQESAYSVELHLNIGGRIPPGVAGFYYAVRTGASQNRWLETAEIGSAADIHRISLAAYQKSGEILYTETAHEESSYYISLFTIYNLGGKEIVSNPKPCRFDRPLTANLFWKLSRNILGGLKLSIEVSANRPMARIPELALCACADNQHLLSYNDPKGTRLLTVPTNDMGDPQKTYNRSYDVRTDLPAKQLKGMKFFIFEVTPVSGENFTLRWMKGFTGKT